MHGAGSAPASCPTTSDRARVADALRRGTASAVIPQIARQFTGLAADFQRSRPSSPSSCAGEIG
jgi:hypothetical protein